VQVRLRLRLETTHHVLEGFARPTREESSAIAREAGTERGPIATSKMSETGRQWQGQIVAGKFELRAYLGGSERGAVFATRRDGQQAAIKLVRANETEARGQLLRWAQAQSLQHPNLLGLFETGRCRIGETDLVYVVMERAEEVLAEILQQRALTPAEAGEMLPPILDALAYLHGHRFVHGSMKSSNILAVGDQVKISSDGICLVGAPLRRSGVYDAPETTAGGCSAATDVWSLGVILAQALTQQLPRWPEGILDAPVLSGPLPQPFSDIVSNCLQRDVELRWTIPAILNRLRPSSHPRPLREVQPEATPEVTLPRATANWRHIAPGAVLIVLAVLVIFVAPRIRDRLQNREAEVARVEPTPAADKTEKTRSPDGAGAGRASKLEAEKLKEPSNPGATPPAAPVEAAATSQKSGAEPAWEEVKERVMPEVPQKARDTIRGTVKVQVRVEIGPSGEVDAVSIDSPGPSRYFANLAVSAASQWKFAPAAADGGSTRRTCTLRFEFTPDATKVFPVLAP
jgi:TonB family protein